MFGLVKKCLKPGISFCIPALSLTLLSTSFSTPHGQPATQAEPYESVYFDYKTMFGEKTMQVRGFYESSGLKLSKEQFDKFPDDFIGYELQYLYFLSFNALQADEKEKMDEILHKKYDFIRTHPFEWFYKFSSRCKEATNLEAYVSFADFLNLYLENEIEQSRALLTFKS